jgi:hypothetical protein
LGGVVGVDFGLVDEGEECEVHDKSEESNEKDEVDD